MQISPGSTNQNPLMPLFVFQPMQSIAIASRQRANSKESEETHAERAGHQSESEGIRIRSNPGISRLMDPNISIIRCVRRFRACLSVFWFLPARACLCLVFHTPKRQGPNMSKRKAEEQNGSPAKKTSLEDFTSVFDGCVCVWCVECFGVIGQERSWLMFCVLMRAGS